MNRVLVAAAAAVGVLAGGAGMMAWQARQPAPTTRAGMEEVVRDYLLAHPEIIPQAMQRLQEREATRALASIRGEVTTPYEGAWAGNPDGDVTLVEYYDYNCGYCRASLPVIRQLLARDPKLKIVFRELPVLGPTSRPAAEASLAAAQQGRFAAFHAALYAAGRVTESSIAAAARSTGVDLSKLDGASAAAELVRNQQAAATLGFTGTPSWVVGDRLLSGALPLDALEKAIAEARQG